MNKIQKKRLYESIMKSVSKTIKKQLNESFNSSNSNEVYNIIRTFYNQLEKNDEEFQNNRMVKSIGYGNIANIKYGFIIDMPETESINDINSLNKVYNENPDIFENLEHLNILISIPLSSDYVENEYPIINNKKRNFFLLNLPDICKKIANKYDLHFAQDDYYVEMYRNNFSNISDIDDLKQACKDVISLQKIIYKNVQNFMYNKINNKENIYF